MHADDEPFGSVHRVEMFNRFPALAQITDNVGIMNRAATQDVRSPVWPVVSRVLRTATAPSPRDQLSRPRRDPFPKGVIARR